MLINFLFPRYANRYGVSLFLLAMRVFIGMLFMMHGLDKAVNFNILVGNFPDPFGIGPFATLLLVVFAELFCAIFFIFGLFFFLEALVDIVYILGASASEETSLAQTR